MIFLVPMDAIRSLCGFTDALERLLASADALAFERAWREGDLDQIGWEALALGRRATGAGEAGAELERWQHAAAAALVGARWGVAGLRTIVADTQAPLARRYFAFLGLAERHPPGAWPLFERYLTTPGAHHAFVAAAVEAARYYPGHADVLVRLFERIRGDQLLRRFLGPKVLESLYVLGEECRLPLFEELLVAGHTDPDVDRCEVTRALVMVRRATGRVAQSCKFADGDEGVVLRTLDEAERRFEATRDRIVPVVVI